MISAVGSKLVAGMVLLGNGVRTTEPLTTRLLAGSKISLKQTIWPAGSGPLQVGLRAARKFPLRWAAVGEIATVLLMVELWRNCSKLKKKKLLSCPLKILGSTIGPPSVNP